MDGAPNGTTVAGSPSGISGSSLNYMNTPLDVEIYASGNVYVADSQNHRIVLWTVGATSGTIVAGTGRDLTHFFKLFFSIFNTE